MFILKYTFISAILLVFLAILVFHFKKKTVVFSFVVFLGYMYVTADPPGYCAAQGQYISDAEFIAEADAGLKSELSSKLKRQQKWAIENPGGRFSDYPYDANASVESVLKWQADMDANRGSPDFARVDRGETRTIFRWLRGYQQLTVTLNPKRGELPDNFSSSIGYVFGICGNPKS